LVRARSLHIDREKFHYSSPENSIISYIRSSAEIAVSDDHLIVSKLVTQKASGGRGAAANVIA
jgi:hypothetical protein